jgi:hypothetical protein
VFVLFVALSSCLNWLIAVWFVHLLVAVIIVIVVVMVVVHFLVCCC